MMQCPDRLQDVVKSGLTMPVNGPRKTRRGIGSVSGAVSLEEAVVNVALIVDQYL
jgi:hypothetical protein